jgi:PHP family Zn ribbon phosphoesterase
MLRWFKTDLHVHTCLSPCADILMSPRKIIATACTQHLDIIGITDHSSSENAGAVMSVAGAAGVVVFPGMEVCTQEEVHVIAVFERLELARELQSVVYAGLHGRNDPDAFGLQVVANERDQVECFEERLLIGATDLSIEKVVERVHQLNGLAIAAHIDRESFGIIGQLGFIPEGLGFDALELSSNISDEDAEARFGVYRRYPFLRSSDAHYLNQLGKNNTMFRMEEPSFAELRKALQHVDGRSVRMCCN